MHIRIAAAFALLAATSLHAQTAAPPAPAASAPALAAPAINYAIAAPVPGSWSWARVAGGSEATFVSQSAIPQLSIRCSVAARRVTISRPAAGAAPFLIVWTSSQARSLPASFLPATRRLNAEVSAYDPLLDAIAFSRGRFAVGISGQQALVVPPWAEVARVIEDCRA
jgi:hypothetical protein